MSRSTHQTRGRLIITSFPRGGDVPRETSNRFQIFQRFFPIWREGTLPKCTRSRCFDNSFLRRNPLRLAWLRMSWKVFQVLVVLIVPAIFSGLAQTAAGADALQEFEARAAKFKSVVRLPQFEANTNDIRVSLQQTIATNNAALDVIAATDPKKANFQNTVLALDNVGYQIGLTANRFSLIKETSQDAALRDAATQGVKELEEWVVGLDYREDVYKVLKAYADQQPKLKGEDAKLLFETMRDYRRAGLDLPKAQRDEVERMRKDLSSLAIDFESNVTKAEKAVKFSKAELEGVPDGLLEQIKTGSDEYTVMANITVQYLTVMDNAKREDTRKRLLVEHDNLARKENIPLLEKILPLRDDTAKKLGYKTWADYQTEVKMVKNGGRYGD